jgi:hypothetical protein
MENTVSHSLVERRELCVAVASRVCTLSATQNLIEVGGILRAAPQAIVDAGASLNCTCTQGRVHQYQVGAGAATGH